MERVIAEKKQSLCYRDGNVFRKYFKYGNRQMAEHEGKISRLYESFAISTPHFIKTGFSKERALFFNDYQYVDMSSLTEENFNRDLFQKIYAILNQAIVSRIFYDEEMEPWSQRYKSDLSYALGILKENVDIDGNLLLQKVCAQEISVIMHGDFSLSNMALSGDMLYLYDFASAGYASQWWDFGYLIATLSPTLGRKLYESVFNEPLLDCIKLASAVRFGRSLRKKESLENRRNIFRYWSEITF